jgi:Putative Flp pilus-assembly TadE/G-like
MRNLILGLARPLRLLGRDERGVIGVLVGLLLGCGVLVGLGAMVIDVGQLYQERAELQNGADAASLAVAKSCATGTCTPGIAVTYADANSSHGLAAASVCGSGSLGTCPASTGLITDCPAAPPAGTNYVDVHTSTATSGGGTVIPPLFADALLGNGNYKGTKVLACSQAEWGGPAVVQGTSFTISACEWDQATSHGTVYAPPPPYPPNSLPSSSLDQELNLGAGSGGGCTGEPAGSDAAGNFGWAQDNGNCTLVVNSGTFPGKTGASVTSGCQTALAADQANKTLIYLPVYTSVSGTGANAVYTVKGFAAFVVTGYSQPGFSASDWLNPANNSNCPFKCIDGYFTQGLVSATGSFSSTNPDLGASIIKLTG